jgi:hypothetical protein
VTTPNIDPMINLVRRFGTDVARMFRQLIADIGAHVRDADPEALVERIALAIAAFAGRVAGRLIRARMSRAAAA